MKPLILSTVLISLLWTAHVFAQVPGRDEPEFMRKSIQSNRRQGFMIGLVGGANIFDGSGTPRPYLQRDDLHRVQFGPRVAPSYSLLVGTAPSDAIAFAVQIESAMALDGNLRRKGYGFTFRLDLYPLVSRGGIWRDLGISPRAGVGTLKYTDKQTGVTLADSGLCSQVGADLIWDALRWKGLGVGPTLGYAYRWSDTISESSVTAGVRLMFYAGP